MTKSDLPLNFFGLPTEGKTIRSVDLWEHLIFVLSLSGFLPFSHKPSSLMLEENLIKLPSDAGRMIKFKFNKAIVFSDKNISGLPPPDSSDFTHYEVYDKLVLSKKFNKVEVFETGDEFINKIFFHNQRGQEHTNVHAVSKLPLDQIDNFDYSDVMSRFKIKHILKENFKVRRELDFIERKAVKRGKNIYSDYENIHFNKMSLDEIIETGSIRENYARRIAFNICQ